jgi:hypothetical protein
MNNGYSNSGGLPHYDGGLNGLENSMDQEGDDADGDSTEAYADGGSTEAYADGGSTEGSALDHALLESLFYNEMMMLESDPLSSNFITQHLSEASAPVARHAPPEVVAEKALLRDFGVTSHAAMLHNSAAEAPLETARTEASSWIHEPELPSPPMVTVKQHAPSHYYPTRTESVSAPPRAPVRSAPPAPIYSTHSSSSYVEPFALSIAPSASVASASSEAIAPQMPVSDERAKQLVSQFATLASRLGIDLPSNVLQSLTRQAALNEPPKKNSAGIQHAISAATAGANTYYADDTALDNSDPEDQNQEEFDNTTLPPTTTSTTDVAPTVQELRRTAEEAIAAVSRNRSHDDSNHGNNNESGSGKPLYSKRRKKPRLPDCESKLAALKAENDLLKRHLQNVSSKAQRFDQEKNEAGKRIKRLLEEGAGPEEMNKVVQDFTDMYSDYGRRRQQELSFHLEQLQRCVLKENHNCCVYKTRAICLLTSSFVLSGWSILRILLRWVCGLWAKIVPIPNAIR